MNHWAKRAAGFLLAGLVGCAGTKTPGKVLPAPKPPPPYPAAVSTPIDPLLRDTAQNQIIQVSNSPQEFVRAHAIEAVRTAAGPWSQGRDIVLKGLSDRAPVVRFAACMAAGELRLKEAYVPVLAMLDDPDPNVRVAVRFCLHRLGDTRFSHDFEAMARAFDPRQRSNTVVALGLLEEKSALKILRAMQRDTNAGVRLQVAEAMWRLGDEQARDDLVAYTISRYPDDRMLALLALAAPRDQRLAAHLYGSLTTDYAEVNLVAARALGMLGSDAGYGVAMGAVKSPDPRLRYLAALALGMIGRPDAQPMLAGLLTDPEPDVRVAAAAAVLQLRLGSL